MKTQTLTIILPLLAYLAGSVPFGLIITRMVTRGDIRKMGSGNIGATNVRRCVGTAWGFTTLLCDVLKGVIPTLVALRLAPSAPQWFVSAVALAAIVGHMFPIYLKLKPSGKGVATALGCFVVAAPAACGLALFVFIIIVAFKRIVSAGSMAAMVFLPLFIWVILRDPYLTAAGVVAALLVISRHKANLKRLFQGEEPTINS